MGVKYTTESGRIDLTPNNSRYLATDLVTVFLYQLTLNQIFFPYSIIHLNKKVIGQTSHVRH